MTSVGSSYQVRDFGLRRHLSFRPLSALVVTPQLVVLALQYGTGTCSMPMSPTTLCALSESGRFSDFRISFQAPHWATGWTTFLTVNPSVMPSWPGRTVTFCTTTASAATDGENAVDSVLLYVPPPGRVCDALARGTPSPPT